MKNGIYIGKDSELGLTESAAILFFRDPQHAWLESRLYAKREGQFFCIGICRSAPALMELHQSSCRIDTVFLDRGRIRGSDLLMAPLVGTTFQLDEQGKELWVKLDAETIGPLALNESFLHDPCPGRRPAEAGHLGECLREWNRGVIWEHIQIEGEDHEIGCQINTDKHMLIFEISPRSVYCRAARFAAVNEGVVFDQNIRQGQASFMIPDNREAAQPLIIEKQSFGRETCVWNGKTVYWSVAAYDEDHIELHGCQGAVYSWSRPSAR